MEILNHLNDVNKDAMVKKTGCVAVPNGAKDFIIRLSNPKAQGMHPETRIQNEVSILTLASAALQHIEPRVVPRVYAWDGAKGDRTGWILQELMPGQPLAEPFEESMCLEQKRGIFHQISTILKALQEYPLPPSIRGWGGLTFSEDGSIISAPMVSVGAGPWNSLEHSFKGRLEAALTKADASPLLQGWTANGVRTRVDAFIESGLPEQFSHFASSADKSIIHGDFRELQSIREYLQGADEKS